jgi:hypothetical protein
MDACEAIPPRPWSVVRAHNSPRETVLGALLPECLLMELD